MKHPQQIVPVGAKTTFADVWKWGQELGRLHARIASRFARADADLRARLAHMESQMATLQTQLTDLTLQLLREREQHAEQRLLALEAQFPRVKEPLPSSARRSVPGEQATKGVPCRSPRKQPHLIPLIEYGASGQYVFICPEEGERHITPASPSVVCVAGYTQLIPLPGPARTSDCLSGPRTPLLDSLSPHSWPVLQLRFREYEASDHRSPGTHGCYPSIPRPIPPETEQSLFPSHA